MLRATTIRPLRRVASRFPFPWGSCCDRSVVLPPPLMGFPCGPRFFGPFSTSPLRCATSQNPTDPSASTSSSEATASSDPTKSNNTTNAGTTGASTSSARSVPHDAAELWKLIETQDLAAIEKLLADHPNKNLILEARRPSDGATALFLAVSSSNVDLVQLLLRHGANPHAAFNHYGHSAIQLAHWNGDRLMRSLLLANCCPPGGMWHHPRSGARRFLGFLATLTMFYLMFSFFAMIFLWPTRHVMGGPGCCGGYTYPHYYHYYPQYHPRLIPINPQQAPSPASEAK